MYYETLSEDPSDLIINEPEESKAAKDAVKAAAGKVAVQAAAGADVPVQVPPTQKEIEEFMARMTTEDKERVLVAHGVSPAAKKRAPKGLYKTQCDDALKKIETTIKYIEDKHKDEHRELYLLGLYVKEFENRLTESDDHDAFKNWLTDHKESIGLTKQTRKSVTPATTPAGSKSVSRAASVALNTSFENDEEAGAGAGSP